MHPPKIKIKDFKYDLPADRIAKYPIPERDLSKLLIYQQGNIKEDVYRNMSKHLPADTLLLFNNTRVIEARIYFEKLSGGIIELFCLEPSGNTELSQAMMSTTQVQWNCLVGGASKWKQTFLTKTIKLKSSEFVLRAQQISKQKDFFEIEFSWDNNAFTFAEVLHLAGVIPLPPYLNRKTEQADYERYQTVYARQEGSVAAPTAGLHFTENLLSELKQKGIAEEFVTLHVGAGTFKPVKSETMLQHEMHKEWIQVNQTVIKKILSYLSKTIIPVGTTSLRTLETLYWMGVKANALPNASMEELEIQQWDVYDMKHQQISEKQALESLLSWMKKNQLHELICHTQILIAPGYQVKLANAILTNFHQPNSTLLLLIAALIGEDWRKVYQYALKNNFRFLSYGDGCLFWI